MLNNKQKAHLHKTSTVRDKDEQSIQKPAVTSSGVYESTAANISRILSSILHVYVCSTFAW